MQLRLLVLSGVAALSMVTPAPAAPPPAQIQRPDRLFTIPDGWPSAAVKKVLDKTPELEGPVAVPAEGSILPGDYVFAIGETRSALVARMQDAMSAYLASAWERRKPGVAVTTPRDALILASLVEKETGDESERRTIAAVYSNRLKRGMRLQADATIMYPITRGLPLNRPVRMSEVQAVNGYNTYMIDGLPAGPICNPGRASIDAVLDPAPSGALYFVFDGKGRHVFADTLEQHNANVRKWYAIRKSRGEM